jgi:hypothetical protein
MIRFLFKGLIRDRNRSLLPFLVTTIGVMLTVVFHAWITGVINNSIEFSARFSSGHVKVMTRAYADNAAQSPNDLAILGADTLLDGGDPLLIQGWILQADLFRRPDRCPGQHRRDKGAGTGDGYCN